MSTAKDLYFVAVKLLVRDRGKLLITHDIFGAWDIPGGRIKPDEFEVSLDAVINRKIKEELGADIQIKVGLPIIFFRHQRIEHSSGEAVRIFAVGYDAEYLGGSISLGQHHDTFKWVDIATFKPEEYFTGGWLAGLQDYLSTINPKP